MPEPAADGSSSNESCFLLRAAIDCGLGRIVVTAATSCQAPPPSRCRKVPDDAQSAPARVSAEGLPPARATAAHPRPGLPLEACLCNRSLRRDEGTPMQTTADPSPAEPAGRLPAEVDVAVIGAGHNGLVAAGYLAAAGLEVCVLEAG